MTKAGRDASYDNDNISNKMTSKVRGIAANVLAPFQSSKYSQNFIDFDDLLILAWELLLLHSE